MFATVAVAALASFAAWWARRPGAQAPNAAPERPERAGFARPREPAPLLWDDDDPPDMSVFASSRMTSLLERDGPPTGDRVRQEAIEFQRQWENVRSERPEFVLPQPPNGTDSESPDLSLAKSKIERLRMLPIPKWIGAVLPLWSRPAWTAAELDLVQAVADALGPYGAPEVTFVAGGSSENRTALTELSRWFRDLVSEDAVLASLIYTLDDGPYVGFPDPGGPSALVGGVRLAPDLRIELVRLADPREQGSFVFRALRDDGREISARLVSKDATWAIDDVELSKKSPTELGAYGWKVHFLADGEYGHLYVAQDGRLRFYFISW